MEPQVPLVPLVHGIQSYRWKQPDSGIVTALKVQDAPGEDLEWEATVLQALQTVEGFPKLHQCSTGELGWLANKRYMVTEYIGPDLETLVEANGPVDKVTLSRIAAKLLDSLAAMHDLGYIHHDLKPANICVREESSEPVIIDLGLSIRFNKDWNFIKQRDSFDGTFMYTSIRNHLRQPQSSRDDVESLLYTLMTISADSIPWYEPRPRDSDKPAIERRERRIRDKKIRLPFHDATPRCLSYALVTAFETTYNEKPLIENIKDALASEWNPVVPFRYHPGQPKLQWSIEAIDRNRRTMNPIREAVEMLRKTKRHSDALKGYSEEELENLCVSQEPNKDLQKDLAEASHSRHKLAKVMLTVLWMQQHFLQRKIGKKLKRIPSILSSHASTTTESGPEHRSVDEAGDHESEQKKPDISTTSVAIETEQTKVAFLRCLLSAIQLPPHPPFPQFGEEVCKSASFSLLAEHQQMKTQLRAVVLDLWQTIEAYISVIAGICHEKSRHVAPEFLRHLQDLSQFVLNVSAPQKVFKKIEYVKKLLAGKQKELDTAKQRLYWDCDGNRFCDPEARRGPEGLLLSKVMIYFADLMRICEDFVLSISSEEYLLVVEKVMAFFDGICPYTPLAISAKADNVSKKPDALSTLTKDLLDGMEESYAKVFGLRMPRVFLRIYKRYMKDLTSSRSASVSHMDEIYATLMKMNRLLFELRKFELVMEQIRGQTVKGEKKTALQKAVADYFYWPCYRYVIMEIGLFFYKMDCDHLQQVLIPTLGTVV
ncbi:uncharacterized protein LOC129600909 isoform X2 [Paramacrobiotus metropolitanus]|uniref:uncharacterized protein LOC129600909 isoform X2 n=1 Tax=Paramacrobiotus metropolitanus TaxID=2943436 RepID=UPI002445A22E|nr:uncharacterized protein LOC129600909 isoform X2 [Paramacrobiotus metropolitanus]